MLARLDGSGCEAAPVAAGAVLEARLDESAGGAIVAVPEADASPCFGAHPGVVSATATRRDAATTRSGARRGRREKPEWSVRCRFMRVVPSSAAGGGR